jgi:hypothetical protein
LAAYQQLRGTLADELGIDPSPQLRHLEAAVLAQDPGLDAPIPPSSLSPASSAVTSIDLPPQLAVAARGPLLGRVSELEKLRTAWVNALQAESGLALVSGEPGIGKTRLLAELAAGVHDEGGIVLYGRADNQLSIPYLPLAEGLSSVLTQLPKTVMAGLDQRRLAYLTRIAPELADLAPAPATLSATNSDADRYLLFSAFAAVLRGLADKAPVLVIADDLHWADAPTLQLWHHLAGRPLGRVLLLGAHRESETPAGALVQLLGDLPPDPAVTRVTLHGLTPTDVATMVQAVGASDRNTGTDDLAQLLHQETSGNPFYLTAILQHRQESGALADHSPLRSGVTYTAARPTAGSIPRLELPSTVRDVLRARVARLGDHAEHILGVAAVIGQEFELDVLARASGFGEDFTLDLLEAAGRASLVTENPTRDAQFRFAHALVQHILYEDLGRTRRARTHARIADAIEKLHGDNPGKRIGELARHALVGVRPATMARAVRHARAAAERALASAAPEEAVRWYTAALTATDHIPEERARLMCRIGLGDAQRQAGNPVFRDTLLAAARTAQHLGEDDLLMRAALAIGRGLFSGLGHVDADKIALLETALDIPDTTPAQRARLAAALAAELSFHPDFARRRALADHAVQTARESDDMSALFDALTRPDTALMVPEMSRQRLTRLREAFALADSAVDPIARFSAAHSLALARLEQADIHGLGDLLAAAQQDARDIREPAMLWVSRFVEACRATVGGDLDAAERRADEALILGQQAGRPDAAAVHSGQLFVIRWHQGRLAELLPELRTVAAMLPAVPTIQASCALAESVAGDNDRARQMLRTTADGDFAFPYTATWLPGLCLWADVAIELRDADAATTLYDRLQPWHRLFATAGPTPIHAIDLSLAGLAALLGRRDRAHQHFRDALSTHERMHSPFCVALTELHWGELYQADGHHFAPAHLAHAVELSSKHGYLNIRRRARRALTSAIRSQQG